jgi:hypothetical protein
MNETGFSEFLRRGGRSSSAIKRCIRFVREFETYLLKHRTTQDAASAGADDLEEYVRWIEREPRASANTHLWALRYFYEYTSNDEMYHLASVLRQQRIKTKPFPLNGFQAVDPGILEKLGAVGIRNSDQMIKAGRTPADRQALAVTVGVPEDRILELVKLSDLARIRGVKGTRARLYYDAGIETVEQMANQDPGELRSAIVEFVEETGFDGIATLPAEARFTVAEAQRLPKVVDY